MEIEAVVFDLDGLMIDSERLVQKTWNIAGIAMGYGELGEHIYHTLGFNVQKRKAYFQKVYGEDFPFDEFRTRTKMAWNEAISKQHVPVKKGLYHLLDTLKQHDIKIGVATSSSKEYALGELKDKQIDTYFDAFIFGDMVKEAKPSPEIYLRSCELLQVPPSHAIALEDSKHGIRSAYDAGMMSIFVPDLVKDSSDVDEMITAKLNDLDEVAQWILQQFHG